jgi:indole-3-glycerol phosphate synthase
VATYLDRILDHHRAVAASDRRDLVALAEQAVAAPAPRGFRRALIEAADRGGVAVIAEIKRRSPSKGDLFAGLDPSDVARAYERGGAACLSVLTDAEFFGGSVDDLRAARRACTLPVLRKDFTVSAADVYDARIMGADALLLIAAALDDRELDDLTQRARAVGLDVLVEIHDEAELARAVAVDADLVGVNQRDLVSFAVDTDRALRMAPQMPHGIVRVAESGVDGPAAVAALAAAGYHAVLVGEHLVTSGDPAGAVQTLRSATDTGA